ncbi:hypothetical protein EMIT048CA2_50192 [Pseudomonas chlororaphis]
MDAMAFPESSFSSVGARLARESACNHNTDSGAGLGGDCHGFIAGKPRSYRRWMPLWLMLRHKPPRCNEIRQ